MKKVARIIFKIISVLLVVVIGALGVFALIQPVLYKEYYSVANKEFNLKGLGDGLVPQGFAFDEGEDLYYYTGYMKDGSASRVYITDGEEFKYSQLYKDGEAHTGHVGGIAVGESLVWIADGDKVWAVNKEAFENERVDLENYFEPESSASTCTLYDGHLWIAEFYDGSHYFTKESHKLTSPAGEENNALICAYKIDEAQKAGVFDMAPQKVISAPDKIQGIAFDESGRLYFSTSWGATNSGIYLHNNVLANSYAGEFEGAPLWFLDNESLIKELQGPPMAEGIVFKGGRLYISYESATLKYIFGILTRGYSVYSIGQ